MSESHVHSHSQGHVHHGQAAGGDLPAAQRASWLLHSAAQRLLGALLLGALLVAAILWATSTQG
jgi:hypothetical protein